MCFLDSKVYKSTRGGEETHKKSEHMPPKMKYDKLGSTRDLKAQLSFFRSFVFTLCKM